MSSKATARSRGGIALALFAGIVVPAFAAPAKTKTWTASVEDLWAGKAEGIVLSSRGRLGLAPDITRVGHAAGGATQIWAMIADAAGNLYIGTGPEGRILRSLPSGKSSPLFRVAEPLVTALAWTPEGDLLAAAAPGGIIYRIHEDGKGGPWCETGEAYVWALAVGPDGQIYAGTGEKGRILTISRSGTADLLYDTDESHVVSLFPLESGELLAGGAGRGRIYLIDAEGHGLVLHDDELPEVAALRGTTDRQVVAALLAPPAAEARPPALLLRLPDGARMGATDESMGSLEEEDGPLLRGTIEGLSRADRRADERTRGRIVRVDHDGRVTELWSSRDEAPFGLAEDAEGRIVFGTGEPARVYRIEPDGELSRLATLKEAQVTRVVRSGPALLLGTSNPAAIYRLGGKQAESGVYLSRPFDAGGPARFGSMRWQSETPSPGTEFSTRTGGSSTPDDTWSAWGPAMRDPPGGAIDNPDGRFLQWRLRQTGGSEASGRVGEVAVTYEPYNRAPALKEFRTDAAPQGGAGHVTLLWSVADPDGDPLLVVLETRRAPAEPWVREILRDGESREDVPGDTGSPEWREDRFEWNTATMAEGDYDVRLVVSDQPSNALGEGRQADSASLHVVIDRTPPEITIDTSGEHEWTVRVRDALSTIRRLEVVSEGQVRFSARPTDGLSDSREEVFRLERPPGAGGFLLRGSDAAGNRSELPLEGEPGPQ